eukprot:jgi/Tetstr1/460915/TSEL_006068.t1
MAKAMLEGVHIQSMQAADRLLAFEAIIIMLKEYAQGLVNAEVDLVELLIRAIDGEKDPRCLLHAFECVTAISKLCPPVGAVLPEPDPDQWAELQACIICYFPISFHPPPGAKKPITREQLVAGLQAAMCAHPLFIGDSVALFLEKATSPAKRDVEDSLAGIVESCRTFGEPVMAPHVQEIWTMLEVHLTGEDDEDAELAAACLRNCCTALSSGGRLSQLAELVLDEKRWTGWMTDLQELAAADGVPSAKAIQKAAGSVNSTCRTLSAVAGTDIKACKLVLNMMVPILTDTALSQRYVKAMQPSPAAAAACTGVALAGLRIIAQAAQEFAEAADLSGAAHPLAPYGNELVSVATRYEEDEDSVYYSEPAISILRLHVLGATLGGRARLASPLTPEHKALVLGRLLSVLEDSPPAGPDVLPQGGSKRGRGEPLRYEDAPPLVCTILRAAGHKLRGCPEFDEALLPRLLAAVAATPPAAEAPACWGGGWALQALLALSEADAAFRSEAIAGLGCVVAGQLSDMLKEGGRESSPGDTCVVACMAALEEQLAGGGGSLGGAGGALAGELLRAADAAGSGPDGAVRALAGGKWLPLCARVAARALHLSAEEEQASVGKAAVEMLQAKGGSDAWLAVGGTVALTCLQVLAPSATAAVAGAQPMALLQLLLGLALRPAAAELPARAAAVALAASLNKWDAVADAAGGAVTTEAAVEAVLQELRSATAASLSAMDTDEGTSPQQVGCQVAAASGWVARGLAMRGHAAGTSAALLNLQHIICGSMEGPMQAGSTAPDSACLDAASQAYGYVLAGGAGATDRDAWAHAVLARDFGASCRVLWEQRTFSAQLQALEAALQRNRPASEGCRAQWQALQLGLLHLLAHAPRGALQQDFGRAAPMLLDALLDVGTSELPGMATALPPSLALLEWLLPDPTWGPKMEEHAGRLVTGLLPLCAYRPAADVRRAALHCLSLVVKNVEYHHLHPLSAQVRKAVDACLDDPKRAVRFQAVSTKHAWAR